MESSCISRIRQGTTVAITGGSGFLGSQVAKLVYSRWKDVQEIRLFDCEAPRQSTLTNITGFTGPSNKPKVSYFPGNILDTDSLLTTFVKIDVVIHCAAVVENGSVVARRKMKKVNIQGTQKVIEACLECGVHVLVMTGSLAQVLTKSKPHTRFDETVILPEDGDLVFPYYGGSKNVAERLVLEANGRVGKNGTKLYTCSLRCPVMFGEDDREFVMSVLRVAKQCCGYFVPVRSKYGTTMQSLYIGNGAWAHVVAAQRLLDKETRSKIGGHFYYIGDHSPVCSMTDFQSHFLRPLGYRVFPVGIPVFLLVLVAFFVEFLAIVLAFVRVDLRTNLNRGSLQFLELSHSYSWEKAQNELQYEPLYKHNIAMARSMEYYRKVL